jgi:hypothetical protein
MEGKYMPYKLIGDVAYLVRLWMYCPVSANSQPGGRQGVYI